MAGTFATSAKDEGRDASVLINGQAATVDGLNASVRSNGLDVEMTLSSTFGTQTATQQAFGITGGGALFQSRARCQSDRSVSDGHPVHRHRYDSATRRSAGCPQIGTGGECSIVGGNYEQAQAIVDVAVQQVATLRGRLGGFQKNQLETNISSQQVALENAKSSESAIRDADYATETAAMTRAQILVQSTTQILAIANQQPQNVLTLLGR